MGIGSESNSTLGKNLPISLSLPMKVGLFIISAATLTFEINLSRIFSIAQFYHFAFMIVSLALFGFGASGTVLTIFPRLGRENLKSSMAWLSLGISLSIIGSYLITNLIPFDSFSISWERKQIAILALHYLALSLPFFFNGIVVGLFLEVYSHKARQVYAINLVGSSLGCICALVAPPILGGVGTIILSTVLAAIASLSVQFLPRKFNFYAIANQFVLLAVIFLGVWDLFTRFTGMSTLPIFDIKMSPYKSLSYALQYPGAELISQKWNSFSRVDIVNSIGIRSLPGLSFKFTSTPPPEYGLYVDGDNLSPIVLPESDLAFTDYLPQALAFRLRPNAKTLILNPKGGLDILVALNGGNSEITVVENNNLVTSGAPHIYQNDRLDVVIEEGRSYLRDSGKQFDIIVYSLDTTYHPIRSGAYSLSEDYRYTVESIEDALTRLEADGLIVISRWLQVPPSEWLRTFTVAVTALEKKGLTPDNHIIAFRTFNIGVLVIKISSFTDEEISVIKMFTKNRAYDLVFLPDLKVEDANRFSIFKEPLYYNAFRDFFNADSREDWLSDYPYEVTPLTDDKPFFSHYFKWTQVEEIAAEFGKTWQPFGGAGFFVVLILLGLALVMAILIILLPIVILQIRRKKFFENKNLLELKKTPAFLYFVFIGLGFLLVEIPLIQQFILYLGNPAYSMATILFSILLFSGIGSQYSSKLSHRKALVLLVFIAILTAFILPQIFRMTLGFSLVGRLGMSVISIAPLGFLMGFPFPKGIARLRSSNIQLIPWVWGINGATSVVSSILAVLLALSLGFKWVLMIGVFFYLGALFAQEKLNPASS